MLPHQLAMFNRISAILSQLEMAQEDAREDFHGALGHAEIAHQMLNSLVVEGRNALRDGKEPE